MANDKYNIDPRFIGSTVTVYPSIDGVFQSAQGYDYVISPDMEPKILQYLVNIGHPAVTVTTQKEK